MIESSSFSVSLTTNVLYVYLSGAMVERVRENYVNTMASDAVAPSVNP